MKPILSCAIILTLAVGALNAVYADSATWRMNPMSGDWNTAANWTPNTVPNGPDDIATFGLSGRHSVLVSTNIEVSATYTCTFKANPNTARTDMVIANGVTINSGAMIALIGHTMGTLTQGMVLTLISNTSVNPVSGTFNNLPDGSIVTISGNNFQVSYEGGDGNDLTLTVVP